MSEAKRREDFWENQEAKYWSLRTDFAEFYAETFPLLDEEDQKKSEFLNRYEYCLLIDRKYHDEVLEIL